MTAIAFTSWTVIVGTLVLVVAVLVMLVRQGYPGSLSENHKTPGSGQSYVERPAGPDAEATGVAGPGRPSPDPDQELPRPWKERRMVMDHEGTPEDLSSGEERLADPTAESLAAEQVPADVPDEERVVPEDVNEYVHDEDEREA